jgi:hypothetical protein
MPRELREISPLLLGDAVQLGTFFEKLVVLSQPFGGVRVRPICEDVPVVGYAVLTPAALLVLRRPLRKVIEKVDHHEQRVQEAPLQRRHRQRILGSQRISRVIRREG